MVILNVGGMTNSWSHQGLTPFQHGLDHFRAGEYKHAQQAFLKAYKVDQHNPLIIYNLAVVDYKLEQYPESRSLFLLLLEHPSYRSLARYNLGLIAYKSHDQQAAIDWFRELDRDDVNDNIRALAQRQLRLLGAGPPPGADKVSSAWSFNVTSHYGYDDNLLDPNVLTGITRGDQYLDMYGAASVQLTGAKQQGLAWRISIYEKNFRDIDAYDYNNLETALTQNIKQASWQHRFRLALAQSTLDATDYQRLIRLEWRGTHHKVKQRRLILRYRYDDLSERDLIYEPYSGWRQRLDVTVDWRLSAHRFRLGYDMEFNDRNDFQNTTDYISYSARRHRLLGAWYYRFNRQWKSRVQLQYRTSEYNDLNTLDSLVREDDLFRAGFQLGYRLNRNWTVMTDYRYSDNDSNIDRYAYLRRVISVGISGYF